ncbi:MAG TPA: hypothetical protein GX707_08065 [Epulopiscium sp.]|nr:hypothetical protein [Candidatus Epulonipiscium sp.]
MDKIKARETMTRLHSNSMTKKELFELEKEIDDEILSGNNYHYLHRLKLKCRHKLYECRECAEAKFEIVSDEKLKEDKELFIKDCERDKCPYRDHFENLAEQKKDIIGELLKEMLI